MIQDLLGIKYPIFQGGMAKVATGTFAATVSNSGGLGIIGAGGMNVNELEEEIALCHKLTTKPFAPCSFAFSASLSSRSLRLEAPVADTVPEACS